LGVQADSLNGDPVSRRLQKNHYGKKKGLPKKGLLPGNASSNGGGGNPVKGAESRDIKNRRKKRGSRHSGGELEKEENLVGLPLKKEGSLSSKSGGIMMPESETTAEKEVNQVEMEGARDDGSGEERPMDSSGADLRSTKEGGKEGGEL